MDGTMKKWMAKNLCSHEPFPVQSIMRFASLGSIQCTQHLAISNSGNNRHICLLVFSIFRAQSDANFRERVLLFYTTTTKKKKNVETWQLSSMIISQLNFVPRFVKCPIVRHERNSFHFNQQQQQMATIFVDLPKTRFPQLNQLITVESERPRGHINWPPSAPPLVSITLYSSMRQNKQFSALI